jgi:hypothetical protein
LILQSQPIVHAPKRKFEKNRIPIVFWSAAEPCSRHHTTTAVTVLTSTLAILVEQVGTFVQGLIDLGDDTADRSVNVRGGLDRLDGTDSV